MTTKLKFIEALELWGPLATWLSDHFSDFRLLVATGTGIFLPAEAGLLDGKKRPLRGGMTRYFVSDIQQSE